MSKALKLSFHICAVAFIVAILVAIYFHIYPNGNVFWLGDATNRWLHGGSYENNFYESNPPLILYLNVIPVLLSNITHFSFISSLYFYVACIAVVSTYATSDLLFKYFDNYSKNQRLIFELVLLACCILIPLNAFGEREHFAVLFTLPYFVLVSLRVSSKDISKFSAIFIGVFAAIGFGLKPYFFIPFVFVELYLLYKTRSLRSLLRPEILAIFITLVIYALSIFILTPTYFHSVFLMASNFYLGYLKSPWPSMFSIWTKWPLYGLLVIPLFCKQFKFKAVTWVLYFATLGFLLNFIVQEKAWYYHFLPVIIFAVITGMLILWDLPNKQVLIKSFVSSLVVLLLLLNYIPNLILNIDKDTPYFKFRKAVVDDVAGIGKQKKVMFFSTSLIVSQAIYMNNDVLIPRFPAYWMLPGVLNTLKQGQANPNYQKALQAKSFIINAVTKDIIKYKPDVLLVDTEKYKPYIYYPPASKIVDFDYMNFFEENSKFKKYFLSRYVKLKEVSGYTVFVRV